MRNLLKGSDRPAWAHAPYYLSQIRHER
ncbi:hypothetical protein [Common midwife toad virus]|uniref:Uncharacterized protein n=1 Tax=Common midwife toad virus TaxID=540070 RepID=A0A2D0XNV4_9VIRU|nr:hypothetical protein [Common midwife toad virus]